MKFVASRLPDSGNLLVFGVGRDSTTWRDINRKGRTVFLEDAQEWIDKVSLRAPDLEIYHVTYDTEVVQSMRFKDSADIPMPYLPAEIESVRWDIVVVDAPMGWEEGQPGRASSIRLAAQLVRKEGVVLLDDLGRASEQHFALLVFGREPDVVLDPARPVGVYVVGS